MNDSSCESLQVQIYEYLEAPFPIADSIYGSTLYIAVQIKKN